MICLCCIRGTCVTWIQDGQTGKLRQLTIHEIKLEADDLIFVPAGWPHQVDNLETSVAMSANFIDASNVQRCIEEAEVMAIVEENPGLWATWPVHRFFSIFWGRIQEAKHLQYLADPLPLCLSICWVKGHTNSDGRKSQSNHLIWSIWSYCISSNSAPPTYYGWYIVWHGLKKKHIYIYITVDEQPFPKFCPLFSFSSCWGQGPPPCSGRRPAATAPVEWHRNRGVTELQSAARRSTSTSRGATSDSAYPERYGFGCECDRMVLVFWKSSGWAKGDIQTFDKNDSLTFDLSDFDEMLLIFCSSPASKGEVGTHCFANLNQCNSYTTDDCLHHSGPELPQKDSAALGSSSSYVFFPLSAGANKHIPVLQWDPHIVGESIYIYICGIDRHAVADGKWELQAQSDVEQVVNRHFVSKKQLVLHNWCRC